MTAPTRTWVDWLALGVGVAVAWVALAAQEPPKALPLDAPSDLFSAARAMRIVEEIAKAPHPEGSDEAKRVRQYLVEKLAELGLTAEIQRPRTSNEPLRNVLARLKGSGPAGKRALLLCAHYDTVPSSPGAGDDSSGVATVLETLRALTVGPPLARDVIVLFDDCEELGLLGAHVFVNEHRWAPEVGLVLNFEARGNHGPSFMFETSAGNAWLIDQFAQADPQPLATSMSMDVYRIMPNDTDLTTFKGAGIPGLNFAFGRGVGYYHAMEDTPANLDPRSLQHHGEQALALARRFGQLDLDDPVRGDVIYTSILSSWVVAYPIGWARPLALGVAACFGLTLVLGGVRKRVRLRDCAAGAGLCLAAVLASVFGVGMFWVVLRDMLDHFGVPWQRLDLPIMTTCALMATVLTLAIERFAARKRSLDALALGAWFWWVVLALVSAFLLPGSSYLFAWPTLFALMGLAVGFLAKADSVTAILMPALGLIPTLILLPPLVRNTFDGLGLRLAAPCMALVVLLVTALLPLLRPVVLPRGSA